MLSENSIETAFGGSSLPAAIEQFNPSLANASDQVTMQEHIAGVGIRNHLSVCTLEVNTVGDGSVHLTFDLTHESVEKGSGGGWGSFPPPHVAIIRQPGALYKGACATYSAVTLSSRSASIS